MRIISGSAKGRRLRTLPGEAVRPTQDKVRGAVFNMLGEAVLGAVVLDLFSGTGAFGIEALSRGAKSAMFIDNNPECVKIIKNNIETCGLSAEVFGGDVYKTIERMEGGGFNIIFADPPYGKDLAKNLLSELDKSNILNNPALVIIEHFKKDEIEEPPKWRKVKENKYGDTVVAVFKKQS